MNDVQHNARGAASVRAILDATVKLLGEYGYDKTTITRITQVTHRPASSIYWHFDTKDDLIAAALEGMYGRPEPDRAWKCDTNGVGVVDELQAQFSDELRTSPGERPIRLGIMLALEGAAADSRIQQPFRRRRNAVRQRVQEWWEARLDNKGTPAPTAAQLTALVLTFLDGHYLADSDIGECLAGARARVLATAIGGLLDSDPDRAPARRAQLNGAASGREDGQLPTRPKC